MTDTPKHFINTLQELDAGVLADKLDAIVREVALNTVEYSDGKRKGKVSLELTFDRIKDTQQIELSTKLIYTKPTPYGKSGEEETKQQVMYVGKRGRLLFAPESQGSLDFSTSQD